VRLLLRVFGWLAAAFGDRLGEAHHSAMDRFWLMTSGVLASRER